MQTVKIKRDTWHYKFIMRVADPSESKLYDTCSYRYYLIKSAVMALSAALVLLVLVVLVLAPYVAAALYYLGYSLDEQSLGMALGSFLAQLIIAAGAAMMYITVAVKRKRIEKREARKYSTEEPGTIRTLWLNFKEKVCSKIELE